MKRIYHKFFYIPKTKTISETVFVTRIALAVMTISMCSVLFCTATYAHFTSNQTSAVMPIQAATSSFRVSNGQKRIGISGSDNVVTYTCPLSPDDMHEFTLEQVGTASLGYCAIEVDGVVYRTEAIEGNENSRSSGFTIRIQAAKGTRIAFAASWGDPASIDPQAMALSYFTASNATDSNAFEEILYGDGSCIYVSETPYEYYEVEEGVTLEMLEEHYEVSAKDILHYNGIEELTVGEIIKIPNTKVKDAFVLVKPEIPATPSNATKSNAEQILATPSNAQKEAEYDDGH